MSNSTQKRLGRGLEALIPRQVLAAGRTVMNLPIDQIALSPYQPRVHFDDEALQGLAKSIAAHGVNQPILVRKVDTGSGYELVAGERRLRASKLAEKTTIPAIVRTLTDKEAIEIALIENLQREDLSAIEEAEGYQRLIEEFSLTHQELSDYFGKSRSAISNTLRLIQLPDLIKQALRIGTLSEGHARTILSLTTPDKQLEVFATALDQRLTVRQLENACKAAAKSGRKNEKTPPNYKSDEAIITAALGTKVKITGNGKSGKIAISFKSVDQLKTLIHKLSSTERSA